MREVAKSMVGFSWAVSLFSAQQIAKLLVPTSDTPEAAAAAELEEVSRVVQSHLSKPVAQQFKAGDEWQRRMIDAMFDAATMQSLDPRKVADSLDPRNMVAAIDVQQMASALHPQRIMEAGVDLLQRSVDTIRQGVASQPATAPDVPAVL